MQTPARRARLRRPGELWGRRTMFVGVLFVLAAVIGGIVLLLVGRGDDSDDQPSERVTRLQEDVLKRTVVDPGHGISVRRPLEWSSDKREGAVNLRSKSGCVSVHLAAPTGANQADRLLDDSLDVLRDLYGNARVRGGGEGKVGGIPTGSRTVSVTTETGDAVTVLLSVGTGEEKAYLTEVVLGNPACRQDLAVAQLILSSVDYTK